MAELKWICFSLSLMLLLCLGAGSLVRDEKWVNQYRVGYDGGFCLPGICIGGSSGVHLGGGGVGVHLGAGGVGVHLGAGLDGVHIGSGGGGVHVGSGGGGVHVGSGGGGVHIGSGGGDPYLIGGVGSTCEWSGSENRNICSGGPIPEIGVRQTMYCTPVSCQTDACSGLHVHLDKGLYKSLLSKSAVKTKEGKHSSSAHHMQGTFKQNSKNVNKDGDVQELKQAAMAPESN